MAGIARIGTTALNHLSGGEETLGWAITMADLAGKAWCDLLLLPESFHSDDRGRVCRRDDELTRLYEVLAPAARGHPIWTGAGSRSTPTGTCFPNCVCATVTRYGCAG